MQDFSEEIDSDLIKYASNTFELSRAKVCLTAAKLKFQRTCFSVRCRRLDEDDGTANQ